ncbi:hypothetical protein GCM10009836_33720 [Pseudonocardia ailaonensis]|uniref:SsuA/THI5-like domain-containing protein n=1 Tax=Pseudonocardia ailaonensis TaxID=367279 RepID=A0ABN2N7T1_9PSEU
MKRAWILAVLAVTGMLASACGGGGASQDGSTKVRIALASFSVGHGLSLIARDGGFFERRGLSVEIINAQGAQNAVAAVASGDVQAFVGTPANAFAAASQARFVMPLRAYAGPSVTLTLRVDVAARLGLPANASPEQRLKALDGLTIASISPAISPTLMLRHTSEQAGARINFTYLDQTTYAAALQAKSIDGFIGSSPYAEIAESQGSGLSWLSGPAGDFPGYGSSYMQIGLGITTGYADANPDVTSRMVRSYLDAAEYVRDHPDEAKAVLRKSFPELDGRVWDQVWTSQKAAFTAPVPTAEDLAFTYREYTESGSAKGGDIDLDRMLAPQLVDAARSL